MAPSSRQSAPARMYFTVFMKLQTIALRVMPACASRHISLSTATAQRFTGMDRDSRHAAMLIDLNQGGLREVVAVMASQDSRARLNAALVNANVAGCCGKQNAPADADLARFARFRGRRRIDFYFRYASGSGHTLIIWLVDRSSYYRRAIL